MTRVAVFIDYQNVYMGARSAFGIEKQDNYVHGQVFPRRVGLLLTDRGRHIDPDRELEMVHVFRGKPSSKWDPVAQGACDRQVRMWNRQKAVFAHTRPLKYQQVGTYPNGNRKFDVREKGIDVLLALTMVDGAMSDLFDVAVLFSADTDLLPAAEAVQRLGKRCEFAAWKPSAPGTYPNNLTLGKGSWCHYLDRSDYDGFLGDRTNYTRQIDDKSTS